ncbi:hypothetical protein QBC34DRAFT_164774 [Podospora aff. communis PSN243]|uniref:Uncharacterized protein n=1 Tax=Podospora aff. communis PSN243 TaxID=3040156 RepID=A0AAV9GA54_9PEZI|nr:hypothetical protein QBC34DRAFT_164774 [Podospora aff. communis PSN243]
MTDMVLIGIVLDGDLRLRMMDEDPTGRSAAVVFRAHSNHVSQQRDPDAPKRARQHGAGVLVEKWLTAKGILRVWDWVSHGGTIDTIRQITKAGLAVSGHQAKGHWHRSFCNPDFGAMEDRRPQDRQEQAPPIRCLLCRSLCRPRLTPLGAAEGTTRNCPRKRPELHESTQRTVELWQTRVTQALAAWVLHPPRIPLTQAPFSMPSHTSVTLTCRDAAMHPLRDGNSQSVPLPTRPPTRPPPRPRPLLHHVSYQDPVKMIHDARVPWNGAPTAILGPLFRRAS